MQMDLIQSWFFYHNETDNHLLAIHVTIFLHGAKLIISLFYLSYDEKVCKQMVSDKQYLTVPDEYIILPEKLPGNVSILCKSF